MRIAGIISTSTVDVPGVPVSVLFTVGCNFSCPYCHNFEICRPNAGYETTLDEIVEKLIHNPLVEGVNITGGEPTLQPLLFDLIERFRKEKVAFIGIDSNGSRPTVIQQLVTKVNRFAIDFKVPWKNYALVSPSSNDSKSVKDTLAFLSQNFKENLEVRTTVVRQYHPPESLEEMARSLQDLNFRGTWVLQEYQFSKGVNPLMSGCFNSWTREELYAFGSTIMKKYSFRVALRTASRGFEKVTITK